MSNATRILVQLHKNGCVRPGHFTECVLHHFGHLQGQGNVFVQLKHNNLIISDTALTLADKPVTIKHPSFCPILKLQKDDVAKITPDIATRGIDVGVAFILESGDDKVLLTKRSRHLRTFPGIWVPAGGHVEEDETLIEAGLRELKEETGLELSVTDCVGGDVKLLALWESVFPPKLEVGLPKRHHIVVYFHAKLNAHLTSSCLEDRLRLQPEEVEACAWLDRDTLSNIVQACEESSVQLDSQLTFRAVVLDDQHQHVKTSLPLGPLLKTLPNDANTNRVSTGTKFALEQFLNCELKQVTA